MLLSTLIEGLLLTNLIDVFKSGVLARMQHEIVDCASKMEGCPYTAFMLSVFNVILDQCYTPFKHCYLPVE